MEVPDMPAPLCLVENAAGGFKINEEAVRVISKITSPITVVAVVGPYRTGKSYLLNRLMGRNDGFALGSAIQSKTKGIWIWCRPHPMKRDQVLVLLDTEGLGDVEKGSNTNDNHMFSLATLLSSTLVYNNLGTLQNDAIDKLHFVSEMTEIIKVRSTTVEEDGSEFSQFFPDFIWTIRDFTLELNLDGRPITADEYLDNSLKLKTGVSKRIKDYNLPRECIRTFFKSLKCFVFDRPVKDAKMFKKMESLPEDELEPEFLRTANSFCDYVFSKSLLKTYQGKGLNGSSLCGLAGMYVETINSGKVPCLENAYETLAEIENVKAIDEAFGVYSGIGEGLKFPVESLDELSALHQKFLKQAVETFMKKAFNDADNHYQHLLMVKTEEKYNKILEENAKASQAVCQQLLKTLSAELDQKLANGAYIKPGGFKLYSKDKAQVVQKYSNATGKGVKAEDVLQKHLQRKEAEDQSILAGDKEMTEKEKELAAQQQAQEQAEQRERAALGEKKEIEQRLRDEKASYEENLRQLETKRKEEQRQQQIEMDDLMNKKMKEQKRLLDEGYKEQADTIKKQMDEMEKKIEGDNSSGFMGFLKGLADTLLPVAPLILQAYQGRSSAMAAKPTPRKLPVKY